MLCEYAYCNFKSEVDVGYITTLPPGALLEALVVEERYHYVFLLDTLDILIRYCGRLLEWVGDNFLFMRGTDSKRCDFFLLLRDSATAPVGQSEE